MAVWPLIGDDHCREVFLGSLAIISVGTFFTGCRSGGGRGTEVTVMRVSTEHI